MDKQMDREIDHCIDEYLVDKQTEAHSTVTVIQTDRGSDSRTDSWRLSFT